jgi:hypothetical protein
LRYGLVADAIVGAASSAIVVCAGRNAFKDIKDWLTG